MPYTVSNVPNQWRKYMDGRIWRFTNDEYMKMREFTPMTNQVSGEILGMCRIVWIGNDNDFYVRFVTPNQMRNYTILELEDSANV